MERVDAGHNFGNGMQIAVVVPTFNAGRHWPAFIEALRTQSVRPDRVLVVDSSSRDGTVDLSREAGYEVHAIAQADFDHGGTRQWAAELVREADIIVYLTQDAVLAHQDSLKRLIAAFDDATVAAAYGRQLPRRGAGAIEAHARLFNYPGLSRKNGLADAKAIGIKAAFISNSFAAYRRRALDDVGGFPKKTIMMEDVHVAAAALLRGWFIAYCADAMVYHSHRYSLVQDMRRMFDVGVFHGSNEWVRAAFGNAEGEGLRFILSELGYLWNRAPWLIPPSMLRSVLKFLGYRLGLRSDRLPPNLRMRLSFHRQFWQRERSTLDGEMVTHTQGSNTFLGGRGR